ncbi:MAG: PadR family transcriptional regulator [Halobacteriota archaeon]
MCKQNHGTCWQTYPERSWIQFLILRILFETPTYGYQLLDEIDERSCGCHKLEPGSIYTVLRRMEEKGLLSSTWERVNSGPDRRIYTVTERGAEVLKMGLSAIVRRKQLFDDLIAFYETRFEKTEQGGEQ